MNRLQKVALVMAGCSLAACYHATIETGLAPSSTVVEKAWASSFINGLVPPSTVETQSKCTSGVSKVETKLSFLNLLVAGITFSIYTPMSIKVTCAQGGRTAVPPGATEIKAGPNASSTELNDAFTQAALTSWSTGAPVYVEMN